MWLSHERRHVTQRSLSKYKKLAPPSFEVYPAVFRAFTATHRILAALVILSGGGMYEFWRTGRVRSAIYENGGLEHEA
jgi:hypothetical protein